MENQVKETGMERLCRLRKEAKALGITGQMKADEFEAAITAKKAEMSNVKHGVGDSGLTIEEAKKIDARLRYEEEAREKFRVARQIKIDRASIVAEAESLKIIIDLPEEPTEIQLARARTKLGIEKLEVKPSIETLGIEASKKGYYVFANLEQKDASHTACLGGKYTINLIVGQIHVLSEYHVKTWNRIAVTPNYKRIPAKGEPIEGQMGEECKRVSNDRRWMFEYLGEAPQDAQFGIVTNTKILDELRVKEEQFV